jgi:hypothetical protein
MVEGSSVLYECLDYTSTALAAGYVQSCESFLQKKKCFTTVRAQQKSYAISSKEVIK